MPRPECVYMEQQRGGKAVVLRRQQGLRQEGDGGGPHDLYRHHAFRLLRRHSLPHDHLHEDGTNIVKDFIHHNFLFCISRNRGTKKMLIYTRFMWRLPGIVLRKFGVCKVSLFVFDEFN